MTRWLCAHLPFFRTERLARSAPQAQARPLAIALEHGDSVTLVAVSGDALTANVRPGMTATAARAMLPNLALAPLDTAAEDAALDSVAAAMTRFTPRVFIHAPQTVLLDITGCERAAGGEDALVAGVTASLERLGYTVMIGLGENPTVAYTLALGRGRTLRELPVRALRLEASDLDFLAALGISSVGALLDLPLETLPARFSATLLTRLRELRGDAVEEFTPWRAPEILNERLDFVDPTDRRDSLIFALRRIAVALDERLSALASGALSLSVTLRAHEGAPVNFEMALSRPTRDSRSLTALITGRFETVDTGERWFDGLEVRVPSHGSLVAHQRDLFGDFDPAREQSFVELLDELVGRLGADAVSRAEPTADPRPELSFTWRPFTAPPATTAQREPALRPPVVFEPHEVAVDCDEAGKPTGWRDGKRASKLAAISGPERIHFGWWSGDDAERDYFLVEDENGARWWLMRRADRWFIVGSF
ncbi:MAG: DNA polymerase Y family protein [Planctomycetes bacterium]|nr:DNA polymerase Y family protein [Planctomycetota bacterium]